MSERLYTEGELTQWLETTGTTPRPDYVDDLLTRTARSRQRSAWRFPERWIPMDLTARAPTITGRQVPLRLIGLVALVVLTLVVGATLFVASQRRLPAPFGPAANGLLVYAAPTDPSWTTRAPTSGPGRHHDRGSTPALRRSRRRSDGRRLPGRVTGRHTRGIRREARFGQMLYAVDTAGGDPRPLSRSRSSKLTTQPGRRTARPSRLPHVRALCPTCGSHDLMAARLTRLIWARTCRLSCRSGGRRTVTSCCWSGRRSRRSASCPTTATATSWAEPRIRQGWGSACSAFVRDGAGLEEITPASGTGYDYGVADLDAGGRSNPDSDLRSCRRRIHEDRSAGGERHAGQEDRADNRCRDGTTLSSH